MVKSRSNSVPGGSWQQVEVGERHSQVFRLAALVGAHLGITVGGPVNAFGRVGAQAERGSSPATQLRQEPQAILNGTETRSPTLIRLTPGPVSSTIPMFSWPSTLPSSTEVRPSYMCRSDPQILVVVIRTSASFASSIRGCGTSSTATSNGPLYTTAFMAPPGRWVLTHDSGHAGRTRFRSPPLTRRNRPEAKPSAGFLPHGIHNGMRHGAVPGPSLGAEPLSQHLLAELGPLRRACLSPSAEDCRWRWRRCG